MQYGYSYRATISCGFTCFYKGFLLILINYGQVFAFIQKKGVNMIRVIVAVDKNWAIGKDGKLLNNIPDDQRFFRQTTTNQVVIMGRKTLESLPGGKPLPNRTNVILTRNEDFRDPDVLVAHSVQEALDLAQEKGADIYIAGGSEIYEQMLNYCDEAYVTFIDYAYQADTYFPNLDKMSEWVLVAESEEQTHFDIVYYYRQYVRRKDFRE